ncbi:MAG: FAD-dependent oxidoreductase [Ilumatobacteraceae bacterium]
MSSPMVADGLADRGAVGADAVVIGAGVIGAAVALELARGGRDVMCVDKGPGPGCGSTSASSSIIRFSYSTLDAVLTAWESAACWRDWGGFLGIADPEGMARFVPAGNLVYRVPGYDGSVVLAAWDDVGIPYEQLDADALAARFPALDTGSYFPPRPVDDPTFGDDATRRISAFYNGDSGYVDDPMLAARNLAHAARHHGARFRFNAAVTAVRRASGRVTGVVLDDGTPIAADVVVNVGGPHSRALNELAGVTGEMRIRHRALRQEVFAVPAPAGLTLDDGAPFVADLDLGQYFRPNGGGRLIVGGTEPACDELEWIADPDVFDEHPSVAGWERAMLRLARRVPAFGVPTRPVGLAALYDASDDWVPIYDRSSLDGWFMACGTSGNQFKNAPLAGQFIRALVDAAAAGVDHDAEPVHFTGPLTGRSIDLGSFSRLRHPASTSGTVMG